MQKYIHEIIYEAEKKPSLKERKEYLKQFRDRKALRGLLEIAYNKDIEIALPDSDPPYRESEMPEGMTDTRIDSEFRRFGIFLKHGPYANMNQTKRETTFINILEGLHPEEAKIFLRAFQHKLRIKGMKIKDINEVFGLKIPEPAKKQKTQPKSDKGDNESNESRDETTETAKAK